VIVKIVKYDNPFVMVDKRAFHDERLSWEAKGLLGYLLCKPPDWTVRVGDLVKRSSNGRDAVYGILRELKAAGYLDYKSDRARDGQYCETEYIVREIPTHHNPIPKRKKDFPPLNGSPLPEKPERENPTLTDTESTDTSPELRSGEQEAPASCPDPAEFTVAQIRALDLTDELWEELREKEKAGKNRRGVLEHVRATLDRPPPAVEAFREVMECFPRRSLWEGIDETVGRETRELAFWKRVCLHWLASGYNPYNVKGALDCFRNGELPATNNRKNHNRGVPPPARKKLTGAKAAEFQRKMAEKARERAAQQGGNG
jgi:hypothetical protein